MGDLTPKLSPEHFNRIEPGTISRQVKQNEPASRGAQYRFHLIILMGTGIIHRDKDGASRMLVNQSLQQLSDFLATLATPKQHHGFTSMIVHGPQTIAFVRLTRRGDHHLLTLGAPHGTQGRQPTDIEFVQIIELDFIHIKPRSIKHPRGHARHLPK